MRLPVYVLALITSIPMAWAQAAIEVSDSLVVCKNNRVVRTIRVNKDEDGGCETVYTKSGIDRVVGNAKFQTSCIQFLNNIKSNLEEASWSCREVSKSKVSILTEATENQE